MGSPSFFVSIIRRCFLSTYSGRKDSSILSGLFRTRSTLLDTDLQAYESSKIQ